MTVVFAVVLSASIWVAGPAAAASKGLNGIKGKDDRIVVDASKFPWRAIGRVNKGKGFCTGVLVGPRIVLTAAHCLWNRRTGKRTPPGYVHFVAGFQRGTWQAHALAERIDMPSSFETTDEPGSFDDWALIRLTEPIGERLGYFEMGTSAHFRPADSPGGQPQYVQAGYSKDRPHVLSAHVDCHILGRLSDKPANGPIFGHDCDAVEGDSGAPIFAYWDGAYRVIAMHVATRQVGPRSIGMAVPVEAFARALERRRHGALQRRSRLLPAGWRIAPKDGRSTAIDRSCRVGSVSVGLCRRFGVDSPL